MKLNVIVLTNIKYYKPNALILNANAKSKVSYFFFTRKSSFLCTFREYRMNEWKGCFFFPGCVFFSAPKIEWMNGMWTFPGKKKTQKNTHIFGKKKHNHFLLKKIGNHWKSEWMTDELFLGKKKHKLVFFFSRFFPLRGKKNTRFLDLNEWMTNVHGRGKKKYDTFSVVVSKSRLQSDFS